MVYRTVKIQQDITLLPVTCHTNLHLHANARTVFILRTYVIQCCTFLHSQLIDMRCILIDFSISKKHIYSFFEAVYRSCNIAVLILILILILTMIIIHILSSNLWILLSFFLFLLYFIIFHSIKTRARFIFNFKFNFNFK